MPSTKQFDVDEALARALEAFWEDGFRATSMTRLLGRMGIQKGSFYATFESKLDVFVTALESYVEQRFAEFDALAAERSPRAAIEGMFDFIVGECAGRDGGRGCLVLNTALEVAPMEERVGVIVRESLERHEKLLRDLVRRGQKQGEIRAAAKPARLARALLSQIIAMRVYARAGMPKAALESFRTQALELID